MSRNSFGIDEAGRGPLAGPVSVAVFGMKKGFSIKKFPKGRDSKKMSEKEREDWFTIFEKEQEAGNVYFEVALPSAKIIDKKGIVGAINLAMKKCLDNLEKRGVLSADSQLLLDGALKAPAAFLKQKTIIKGDEKEKLIACASIVAKVSRDRLMKKLPKKYAVYDFGIHKGYGTLKHRQAIKEFGLSDMHRKSFLKRLLSI